MVKVISFPQSKSIFSIFFIGLLFISFEIHLGTTSVFGAGLDQMAKDAEKFNLCNLKGKVIDKASLTPLTGVKVIIINSNLLLETDQEGHFCYKEIDPGSYEILFEKEGYLPYLVQLQIAGQEKEVEIIIELEKLKKEIMVTAEASKRAETIGSSLVSLTGVDLRNLPGTFDDFSRALQTWPGVASSGDFKNDLIVRGGSPVENLFIIEGVKVPTLSHFGSQNSCGGVVSFLNPSLIKKIDFFTGGFPACYGDSLSSVIHVHLQEGDRSQIKGNFELNLLGITGGLEGPLFSSRGSWIFSLRKEFFSSIPRYFTHEMTVVPDYFDGQAFFTYDLTNRLKFSLITIGAQDYLKIEEDDEPDEQRMRIKIGDQLHVLGMKLRAILGQSAIGYFTFSAINNGYNYSLISRSIERQTFKSKEKEFTFQLAFEVNPFSRLEMSTGLELIWLKAHHYLYYRGGYLVVDRLGYRYSRRTSNTDLETERLGSYFQISYFFSRRLKTILGLRGDYLGYTDDFVLGPRLGVNLGLSSSTEMKFSLGIYYQSPEPFWLKAHPENKNLKFLKSNQITLGIKHGFKDKLTFNLEAYTKSSSHYPVDSANPYLTLANQGGSLVPTFFGSKLLSLGAGYARGIEISAKGSLWAKMFWLTNYSFSRVRFKALDGVKRPGDFDYGHIFNLWLNYEFSSSFSLSLKWRYTGGAPYTPFDFELSRQKDTSYFDLSRINQLRYPPYHRLDLKLEKKFSYRGWFFLISLDIQNVYNRKNVYYKFWDEGQEQTVYLLPFLPLLALKIEF
ncbi:MAG: TonB-dependent receptor [Candidatus Aminicenantes bacterium]|nr:TonB-dependent receptor [Candidatus Aminicenantes bacterium]